MEGRVHEFRRFNVTVFEEFQTVLYSRQFFRFEIDFQSFFLTNRQADILHSELEKYLLFSCCRCCLGQNVTVAVELGPGVRLFVYGDEIQKLKKLISKIKVHKKRPACGTIPILQITRTTLT